MECNGPVPGARVKFFDHVDLGGGGGGLQPKKTEKKTEKNSPKFEICGSVRFFPVFSVFFFGFLWCFLVFFRSELRQEIPAIQKSCQQ